MMPRGLQVGFHGVPVAPATLIELKALGVHIVRCGAETADDATTRQIAQNVLDAGMIPFLTLDRYTQSSVLPEGTHCEPLNEPELNGYLSKPLAYRELVIDMHRVKAKGVMVWGGCTVSTARNNLDWLAATLPKTWPDGVGVSIHSYRPDTKSTDNSSTPHPGFANRSAEVAALKAIIGDRVFGVGEFGYHTSPRYLWGWQGFRHFPTKWTVFSWTDQEVADWVYGEFDFWERHGATSAVLFQNLDGPDAASERWGIRRRLANGMWEFKPVAYTFLK